jgi:alpha-beta hydrolase superfamily lysophospholipase
MHRFLLLLAAAIPLCSPAAGAERIQLPADLSGTLDGAEYRIRVPANWNGTLLVYTHGAGTVTVEVAPATYPPTTPTLEEQLLSRGYALAGSLYEDLNVTEGVRQTLKLTHFFDRAVGHPERTLVWGVSLGGSVAIELIEDYPAIFDGAIPVGPLASGWAKDADFELRYGLAYAAAFGWPSEWWGPIENLRDDLYGNEGTLIVPVFQWYDEENGTNFGQWEFVRLMLKLPSDVWWNVDPLLGLPGWAIDGWKATAVRSQEERIYGGPVAQNVGTVYELTGDEKSYLAGLGVNADERLAWMNDHANITAQRPARNHIEHAGTPSGRLRRPVVTMHGILDALLPVWHEADYHARVEAAGRSEQLVQAFANVGHSSFSAGQFLSALSAIEHWLDTGVRPGASFFPEAEGFDNSFVPPPWPY